jgi:hypothetical protein
MKFLGEFIQHFISRFRNDVFLEDVSTGTIASGGNLGLDSNNKIVKADVPADGDITAIVVSNGASNLTTSSGSHTTQFLTGEGIDVAINEVSAQVKQVTYSAEDASESNKGVVELATTGEATTGTDTARAVTPAGAAAVHATAQTGKNYRIINTSFRQDIDTTKYYLPFKSQDENVTVHREEVSELAVCDGRVVSVSLRVENLNTHSGDANVTFGVTTNVVGATYTTFTEQETETLAINDGDDHHLFHYVFSNAKHWDSTDMFAISIQSDTDISGSNERFYITVVIEDDWSTYLGGSSREIDSTP